MKNNICGARCGVSESVRPSRSESVFESIFGLEITFLMERAPPPEGQLNKPQARNTPG